MSLDEIIDSISTKKDLADFIAALRDDLAKNSNDWENPTLGGFLEAMEAWIRAKEFCESKEVGKNTLLPTWQTFSEILISSKIYE